MRLNPIPRLADTLERRLLGPVRYWRRRGVKIGSSPAFYWPRLAEPHLCEFGHNVFVAGDCTFLNHDGAVAMLNRAGLTEVVNVVGRIIVHDNVFIGMHCTIMMDVEIGPNAIVAANSVVTKDVPPNSVVGGVPARVICTIDEYLAKYHEPARTLWAESELHIRPAEIRYFMTEGHRGKMAVRLGHGKTQATS